MDGIRIGSHVLQPNRQLLAGSEHVRLGPRALAILTVLAESAGEIVTKDELMAAVWGDVTVEENALQVHVTAVRKALGADADRLSTVHGVGYQLELREQDGEAETERRPSLAERALEAPARNRSRALLTGFATLSAIVAAMWWLAFDRPSWSQASKPIPVLVHSFSTVAKDGDDVALAAGVTGELINRLRGIDGLRVATALPDGSPPSNAFERTHVVEGTLQRSGDELRTTVRLLDPGGAVLWSQSFDRTIYDLFELQEEIASSIANSLSVSLDVGVNARANGGTDNPDAYANFVLGISQTSFADPERSIRYLRRAVELDPMYQRAWSELTAAYTAGLALAQSRGQLDNFLTQAERASSIAYDLDRDSLWGLRARALYLGSAHQVAAGDRALRAAAEVTPAGDPAALRWLAGGALGMGRIRKALDDWAQAMQIDPVYRDDQDLIRVYVMTGKYEESLALYRNLASKKVGGYEYFAAHAYWSEYFLEGERAARALVMDTQSTVMMSVLELYDSSPELPQLTIPELRAWLDQKYGAGGQIVMVFMAAFAVRDGHDDAALRMLRVAYERPGGNYFFLWHPIFEGLRKKAGYSKLVTDLGFAEAWRESGEWGDYCRPVSDLKIACF